MIETRLRRELITGKSALALLAGFPPETSGNKGEPPRNDKLDIFVDLQRYEIY